MDSEVFFSTEGEKFKKKTGIYVLQAPFKSNGNTGMDIFKVGYASTSLYKRIRDYKTAYATLHFKIFCVYAIPERVFGGERTMLALATEKQLHKMLDPEAVMRDPITGKVVGEWYKDIRRIEQAVLKVRDYHLSKYSDRGAKNWHFYIHGEPSLTRSAPPIVDITTIPSKFKGVEPRALSTRRKPKIYDPDEWEAEHNKSHNYLSEDSF